MQALFELAFGVEIGLIQPGDQSSAKSIIDRSVDIYKMSVKDQEFCRELYYGSIENLDALDQIIAPAAPEWPAINANPAIEGKNGQTRDK